MKKNIISVLIVLLVVIALPSCKKLEESYTSGTEQMTADQLFDQGKYEEAIKEYQKAIDTDADGVLHLKLARAYEKIGKIELALENYKIAKEISDFLTNDANNKIEELEKIKEIQN
ncbi:MAG: tetratricopeptide repeat protein, partial [Cyanobacteriota bacterium]